MITILDATTRTNVGAATDQEAQLGDDLNAPFMTAGSVVLSYYSAADVLLATVTHPAFELVTSTTPRELRVTGRGTESYRVTGPTAASYVVAKASGVEIFRGPVSLAQPIGPSTGLPSLLPQSGAAGLVVTAVASLPVIGGIPSAGVSRLAACIGDSLTTSAYKGPIYWTNGLLGAPLTLLANCGNPGQTLLGLISQIENSYTSTTPGPGFVGLPALGWAFVRVGTNDIRYTDGSGYSVDSTTQANYISLWTAALTYAEHVIVLPVPPIGGVLVTKNTAIPILNTWIQAYVESDTSGRLHWLDDCTDLVDGSGNIIANYFTSDELHWSGAGSYRAGLTAQTRFAELLSNQTYSNPLSTSGADVYPAQPQWSPNHVNAGTGGTLYSGWTGTAADGYYISTYGSGTTGVCSVVAADGGDSNATPWQRMAISTCSASGAVSIAWDGAGRTISSGDPDTLEQLIEVRFNGLAHFESLTYWMQFGGSRITQDAKFDLGLSALTDTVTLQQKLYRIAPSASGTPTLYIYLQPGETASSGIGSIDFRCATVRG